MGNDVECEVIRCWCPAPDKDGRHYSYYLASGKGCRCRAGKPWPDLGKPVRLGEVDGDRD